MSKLYTLDDVVSTANDLIKNKDSLEIGDIVSEYQKKWVTQMGDIVKSHKDYAPLYYILVVTKKEHGHVNILRNKTFIRKSRPDPDWNTDCYSYDNRSNEFKLEWSLPPKEAHNVVLKTPLQWDPFLVSSIRKFLSGELSRLSQEPQPSA